MRALKTPPNDAPAAAWGAFAESIPGWRNPSLTAVLDPLAMPRIEVGSPIGDLPSPRFVLDPDHWAWEGWLLKLLGDPLTRVFWYGINVTVRVNIMPPKGERVFIAEHGERGFNQPTLGRACIAAAAANGRWPGGEL